MKTRITELLNIEYPIIQGGMAWVANAQLAANVSKAGGIGFIGAANAPAEWVREQIREAKKITDKPFGVNIMLLSPHADEVAKVVAEEGVAAVTTGAGNPAKYMKMWKEAGIKVMPVVASVVVMDELGKRDWMKELDAFDVMDSGNIDDWTDLSVRLDSYIIERVERSVNRLIEEQTGEKMAGNKILSKVNLVNDAAQKAYKEYGRKLTAAELAEFMHVAEDEVKEALRLSANKIENVIVPD